MEIMINYWWVTRPKRKLDSVPEVLTVFAELSLDQVWSGQRNTHLAYEDALENAGLKRAGERRDQGGSGARTYAAWLESLGLIFKQESTGNIMLTLAGEAIMDGDNPVSVLSWQVWKYQFPSAYSIGRGVDMNPRFHIRPFRFLLRLLMDSRIRYLTEEEIAKIVITEAENESDRCYEHVVDRILQFRSYGDEVLTGDFFDVYTSDRVKSSRTRKIAAGQPIDNPFGYLLDTANTMENWLEYTQICHRDYENGGRMVVLDDKRRQAEAILSFSPPFIDHPEDEERYQRKYGIDLKHNKDTRDLTKSKTITARVMMENKIRASYIRLSMERPIYSITPDVVSMVCEGTGADASLVEDYLSRNYHSGSIGAFLASYHEMAFSGRDEATQFEKTTTDIFRDVFGYNAIHLGQTGSKSAPDILLISDSDGYQAVIDNKAYSKYSITGDHHNRMVHNYIEGIGNYSSCTYPIGFFSYIAGGFISTIDSQIQSEAVESGINGSCITVDNFIQMIQRAHETPYTHQKLRKIFGLNRRILMSDI